jgi:hypothetical protein
MAQGGATTVVRPDELVVIGTTQHIFVIAGMSAEIAEKVTTDILRAQYANLLSDVLLIPYDRLLQAFESRFPPRIHILQTSLPIAVATLDHLLRAIEQTYANYRGYWLSDEVVETWERLESEYLRLTSTALSDPDRLIKRSDFEITYADRDPTGKRPLATEAPNPSGFALQVCYFIVRVIRRAEAVGLRSVLPADVRTLWDRCGAYASD